ncbi:MAG: hypothetical protein FWF22_05045, partial [Treponema sp.]|nr:hypothetical protein [Treponema sp.]
SGTSADVTLNLKLAPVFDLKSTPVSIDEAYARVFLGPVNIEGGLRKLSWGRADSFGPLDVINPLDYSDLSGLSDPQSIKIARPLLRLSWNLNYSSKLEAVFVPWFEGDTFAGTGRWAPSQITTMPGMIAGGILSSNPLLPASEGAKIENALNECIAANGINYFYPDSSSFNNAQGGIRFTTSIGPADLGIQYYYGRLPRPAMSISIEPGFYTPPAAPATPSQINLNKLKVADYNPYQQIGADYAQVIAGFNIRAEAGANITSDLDGTDGTVYNPALVWSLGFDRDVLWGININAQGNGSIRLFWDKINSNPMLDTEAGKDMTSTRITLILSKKFLMDQLELKTTGLWGIEDRDFLVMPAVNWSRDSVSAGLSAGFFFGDTKGELGQYWQNNYVKVTLGYKF